MHYIHALCSCVCVCVFTGFLDSEPLREADEDVSDVNLNNCMMTEEEREEIQQELAKVRMHTGTLLSARERWIDIVK